MVQGAGKSKYIKKQGNEFVCKMQYTLSGGFEISIPVPERVLRITATDACKHLQMQFKT